MGSSHAGHWRGLRSPCKKRTHPPSAPSPAVQGKGKMELASTFARWAEEGIALLHQTPIRGPRFLNAGRLART